jgi:hypothetical protein
MRINLIKTFLFSTMIIFLTNCATQTTSTIEGFKYDATKNETDYFVVPYGSVVLPGKWEKTNYDKSSHQQYFRNQDSVIISIRFGRINFFEFNKNGTQTGYNFIKSFYEWDSKYFVDSFGLKRQLLVSDSTNNFIAYRIYGQIEQGKFDTYFLIGENNGNFSNFSISHTDKLTEKEKTNILKNLFLNKK